MLNVGFQNFKPMFSSMYILLPQLFFSTYAMIRYIICLSQYLHLKQIYIYIFHASHIKGSYMFLHADFT